tara:strand:+ start:840 stop:1103 length:264 start_codon:yes stop_codon:yes gene_type:complete
MSEYKEVIQWTKTPQGRPRANKLGSAKESGGRLYIKLDVIPIPAPNRFGELSVEFVVQDKRERGEEWNSSAKAPQEPEDYNDEPPFG